MLNTRTIQNTFPGIASDLEEGTERQLQSREEVGASLRSVLSCKVEVETHRTAQPHAAVLRALSPSAPAPPAGEGTKEREAGGPTWGPAGGRRLAAPAAARQRPGAVSHPHEKRLDQPTTRHFFEPSGR